MPFSHTELINSANNELFDHNSIVYAIKLLKQTINRTASRQAKANAEWHDDPTKDDHEAHHAPDYIQFPKEIRNQAILELVEYYLNELA